MSEQKQAETDPVIVHHDGNSASSWEKDLLTAVKKVNTSPYPISQDLKTIQQSLESSKRSAFCITISDNYIDFTTITKGSNSNVVVDLILLSNGRYVLSTKEWKG